MTGRTERSPEPILLSSNKPLKISLCTMQGRIEHLRQTLPANMAVCADDPDVEFVLLDYQSDDGSPFVREEFAAPIAAGRLRYALSRARALFFQDGPRQERRASPGDGRHPGQHRRRQLIVAGYAPDHA